MTEISEYIKSPELLGGRVKTLHPKIHAGILAVRDNNTHLRELEKHGIKSIDLLVVNLYPFKEVIKNEKVSLSEAIENIDIGGPTMLRAGAKNYKYVTVVVNHEDYGPIIRELNDRSKQISCWQLKPFPMWQIMTRQYPISYPLFKWITKGQDFPKI